MSPHELIRRALIAGILGTNDPATEFETVTNGCFVKVTKDSYIVLRAGDPIAEELRKATLRSLAQGGSDGAA